jgi:8-oxo-dGTP diphosphatase
LHIAVGVIYNDTRDRVLLAKRPAHADHGGLWEFPGGKRNPGEDIGAALRRELYEELNLVVHQASPLLVVDHEYSDRAVKLDVWEVTGWGGQVMGKEGQQIEWVSIRDLGRRKFPAANRAIVSAVTMPPLYVITPDLSDYGDDFFLFVSRLLRAGMRALQFRSTRTDAELRARVATRLARLCDEFDCLLMLNDTPGAAVQSGAGGVHLNSARLLQMNERPLDSRHLVGASCHNRTELMQAGSLRLDYALLGPVSNTVSHEDADILGWERFEALARSSPLPVYALGGMRPADMTLARAKGARGLAMISGIWSAADPEAAVSSCLWSEVSAS